MSEPQRTEKDILEEIRSSLSRIEDSLVEISSQLESIKRTESDNVLVVREADFTKIRSYASDLIGKLHP